MKTVTPKQISVITVNHIAQSGIDSAQYQALLKRGSFTGLLREFTGEPDLPEPTITSIRVPVDNSCTLVAMRDATRCDGYVDLDFNDEYFPVEARESCK